MSLLGKVGKMIATRVAVSEVGDKAFEKLVNCSEKQAINSSNQRKILGTSSLRKNLELRFWYSTVNPPQQANCSRPRPLRL